MSSSKLCICEMETWPPGRYYVRVLARKFYVVGDIYNSLEEAQEQLRKCEQDPEYLYWQQYYCLGKQPNPKEDAPMRNMSKNEIRVLNHLFQGFNTDHSAQTFASLSQDLKITERQAKTAVRALKRRGYAEHIPYWREDGMIGGSGYDITVEGIRLARAWRCEEEGVRLSEQPAL